MQKCPGQHAALSASAARWSVLREQGQGQTPARREMGRTKGVVLLLCTVEKPLCGENIELLSMFLFSKLPPNVGMIPVL